MDPSEAFAIFEGEALVGCGIGNRDVLRGVRADDFKVFGSAGHASSHQG